MRMTTLLLASAACLIALAPQAFAQNAAALSGNVSSAKEGAMEGVVVSAKRDGSTITVSVISDDKGRFSFPAVAARSRPLRAQHPRFGYDLDGPERCDRHGGQDDKIDVKLKPTQNLVAQMTNAEWLMSMPGTDDQKRLLLRCNSCHTLERIVSSTHDADEFSRCSCAWPATIRAQRRCKPQRLARRRGAPVISAEEAPKSGGMACQHQSEPAGQLELAAQDAAAAHRQIHARHHHRIRHAE